MLKIALVQNSTEKRFFFHMTVKILLSLKFDTSENTVVSSQ